MSCGSSNAANALAGQQQQQQQWTDRAIENINNAFAGFTPQFYQGAGRAYQNYALPQLQQQFAMNQNQLNSNLANQGILNSSYAQQARAGLSGALNQGQQQIAGQALQQQQQLQQQVGQEKNQLYSQAQTTNNPSQIGQQALGIAANTTAPSTFAPIGNFFNQFGQQYLAGQNANTYNNFANQYLNTLSNPSLFGQQMYSPFYSQLPSNQLQ